MVQKSPRPASLTCAAASWCFLAGEAGFTLEVVLFLALKLKYLQNQMTPLKVYCIESYWYGFNQMRRNAQKAQQWLPIMTTALRKRVHVILQGVLLVWLFVVCCHSPLSLNNTVWPIDIGNPKNHIIVWEVCLFWEPLLTKSAWNVMLFAVCRTDSLGRMRKSVLNVRECFSSCWPLKDAS